MSKHNKALLLLADGTVLEGQAFGAPNTTAGELCFNTGMTGYQEIFTDPSYTGQILVTTHSHIGNYGVLPEESESNGVKIAGLVCRNFSEDFSRYAAHESLDDFLISQNVPVIHGIDTRALVRKLRSGGVMNAVLSTQTDDLLALKTVLESVPDMSGLELASAVSTFQPYFIGNANEARFKVAAMDFGVKKSILTNLAQRGCYIKVFPAKTPFSEVAAFEADGYFLSNGPGDPAAMPFAIELTKQLLATDKPLFGICLGHQILALAMGMRTYKMPFGHRGVNHPVLNLLTGKSEITSQNHGFAVDMHSVNSEITITHTNLNDNTLEGIRIKGKSAFSVQYHPESSPGPHDSRYLFDDFVQLMERAV